MMRLLHPKGFAKTSLGRQLVGREPGDLPDS